MREMAGRHVLITGAARGIGAATTRRLHARGARAIERGVARRSRRVAAPDWVRGVLAARNAAQRLVELGCRHGLPETLAVARSEPAPLTTPQPE